MKQAFYLMYILFMQCMGASDLSKSPSYTEQTSERDFMGTKVWRYKLYSDEGKKVAAVKFGSEVDFTSKRAHIWKLWVDKKYRKQGLGTKLFFYALKKLTEENFEQVELVSYPLKGSPGTNEFNQCQEHLNNFYHQLGCQQVEQRPARFVYDIPQVPEV